jgi:hypothetical protein
MPPTSSDWPLVLMLDENWLRARRVLVHCLEARHCWHSRAAHAAFWKDEKAVAERLRDTVLLEALGADDFAVLNSEAVFGQARRVVQRAPLVLGFGYELGWCLCALADPNGDPELREKAAVLSALFNFGISLFDLVLDSYPEAKPELANRFGGDLMERLMREPGAVESFGGEVARVEPREMRILMKVVANFFHRLAAAPGVTTAASRDALHASLVEACHAELDSGRGLETGETALRLSRAKSTLPFQVIYRITRLFVTGEERSKLVDLAHNLGVIFWRIDDLVDIPSDYRDSALNSLLATAANGAPLDPDPAQNYAVLASLLTGSVIEGAVREVGKNVTKALTTLRNSSSPAAARLAEALRFYIRSWLE